MKKKEIGYILIELLIAVSIMALVRIVAGIYQVFAGSKNNNTRMKVLHKVQNAG